MSVRDIQIMQQEREEEFRPPESTPAVMVAVDGSVDVAGRPRYVWVSEYNQPQSLDQVLNLSGVQSIEGNLVSLGLPNQAGVRAIISLWDGISDLTDDADDLGALSAGPHAQAHQYPSEANVGADPVLIYPPALQLLKTTGDGATLTVSVAALTSYRYRDVHKVFNGSTLDLTSSVPAVANTVRYTLVYLNAQTNTLATVDGTAVPVGGIPIPKPVLPDYGIASAYVQLTNAQSTIVSASHVVDAREFLEARFDESHYDSLYLKLDTSNDPLLAGLLIDGSADEVQLTVQGWTTQTNDLFVAENSAGTDVFTISNTGATDIADSVTINGSQDAIQLLVTGDAAQTADIFEVENSGGTPLFTVEATGQIYAGPSTSVAGEYGIEFRSITSATSGTNAGMWMSHAASATVNSTSKEHGLLLALTTGSLSLNYPEAYGQKTSVVMSTALGGIITDAYGHSIDVDAFTASSVATNARGLHVNVHATLGTITNAWGLEIENVSDGATINRAIETKVGDVLFGDNVTVDGSQDVIQLTVKGHSTQTEDIILVEQDSGSNLFVVKSDRVYVIAPPAVGNYRLGIGWQHTETTSSYISTESVIWADAAGTTTNIAIRGLAFARNTSGTIASTIGVRGEAWQNAAGGTLTNAYAFFAKNTANNATGPMTNSFGYYTENPVATGTITNAHGLFVANISNASTINRAITTNAGDVVFNDGGDAGTDIRIETDAEENFFYIDGGDEWLRVGDWDTNYVEIDKAGDMTFTGGAGLAFAEIYVKDSSATISVDSDLSDVKITQFTTNGESNNCTADAANDKITFTKTGKYLVTASIAAFLNAGATVTLHVAAYLNGAIQNNIHAHRTISSTDKGSISLSGIIDVTTASWDLDLRANIDDTVARNLTVEDVNLSVVQIGGT